MQSPDKREREPARSSSQSEEGRHRGRRSRGQVGMVGRFNRYFLYPVLIIGFLGLVAYFAFEPAKTRLRAWRSVKVVADGEAAMAAGDVMEAHKKTQLALQMAPQSLPVHSLAARFYTSIGQPDALAHWQVVVSLPGSGISDRYRYIDAALMFLRYDLASDELAKLAPTEQNSLDYQRRILRLQVGAEDFANAVAVARNAQGLDPKDEEIEYLLGLALLRSGIGDWVAEGRRLLLSIALAAHSRQAMAADTLRSFGSLTGTEARQIARSLERRADISFRDRLMISGFRLTRDDEARERAVAAVGEDVSPSNDPERIEYVNWCLNMAAPRAARHFIERLESTNSSLISLNLEAIARMEDWPGLDKAIEAAGKSADPLLTVGLKAWRQARQGEPDRAAESFRLAVSMANELKAPLSVERLLWIAGTAERAGLPLSVIHAWESLLKNRPTTARAGRAILEQSAKLNRIEPAYTALRELMWYAPGDAVVQRTVGHSFLVLNRDIEDAARIAFAQHQADPEDPGLRVVAAFAHFRQGKAADGLELLDEGDIDTEKLDPRLQVLAALVRNGAGQRETARGMARSIPTDRLRVEEVQLLATIQ